MTLISKILSRMRETETDRHSNEETDGKTDKKTFDLPLKRRKAVLTLISKILSQMRETDKHSDEETDQ